LPRAAELVFDTKREFESQKKNCTCSVKLSVLEIYQEKLKDLLSSSVSSSTAKLSDSSQMRIREQTDGVVWVEGLTEVVVLEAEAFNKWITLAMKRRVVGSHNMNAVSSRSHLCCMISVSVVHGLLSFTSKLHLVDLAGSEMVRRYSISL